MNSIAPLLNSLGGGSASRRVHSATLRAHISRVVITEEERKEINRLKDLCYNRIEIKESNNYEETLEKLDLLVDEIRENGTDKDIEELAYEFGALYGDIFVKSYGWEWYVLEYENLEDIFFTVVSRDLTEGKQPFNYFYQILNNNHSNNFILGYNMVRKHNPKSWKFMIIH